MSGAKEQALVRELAALLRRVLALHEEHDRATVRLPVLLRDDIREALAKARSR